MSSLPPQPGAPFPPPPAGDPALQLRAPGTIIALFAALNFVFFAGAWVISVIEAATGQHVLSRPDQPPANFGMVAILLVFVVVQGLIIVGAIHLARVRSRALAMLAAIGVMIPCTGPCCVIGVPLGIWSLTLINRIPRERWS